MVEALILVAGLAAFYVLLRCVSLGERDKRNNLGLFAFREAKPAPTPEEKPLVDGDRHA